MEDGGCVLPDLSRKGPNCCTFRPFPHSFYTAGKSAPASLPLSGTLCWNQGVADAVESRAVENQRTPPSFDAGSSRRRTGRLCERTWAFQIARKIRCSFASLRLPPTAPLSRATCPRNTSQVDPSPAPPHTVFTISTVHSQSLFPLLPNPLPSVSDPPAGTHSSFHLLCSSLIAFGPANLVPTCRSKFVSSPPISTLPSPFNVLRNSFRCADALHVRESHRIKRGTGHAVLPFLLLQQLLLLIK